MDSDALQDDEDCARRGCLIAVVGPSGAGKDTLMAYAARHFQEHESVTFARRTITRDADAGSEDHDCVSDAEFDALETAGRFAVSWQAHGLRYGIGSETRDAVASGKVVVANGSRSALGHFKTAYRSLLVINVTASPEVLATRLAARGRESHEDIIKRLARGSLSVNGGYDVVTIDNSGPVESAGRAMVEAILAALPENRKIAENFRGLL